MVKVKSNVAFEFFAIEPVNIENCSRILKKLTRKLESFTIECRIDTENFSRLFIWKFIWFMIYYLNKKIYLNIYYLYLFTFYLKI